MGLVVGIRRRLHRYRLDDRAAQFAAGFGAVEEFLQSLSTRGFPVIDADGFRPNVGIVLSHADGRVLWARRIGQEAWQFPQGGIKRNETPEAALYRELEEELGLKREHVVLLGVTDDWLRYRLPNRLIRRGRHPVCIGQKQKWFLLRLIGSESEIRFDSSPTPEFDRWRWVDYWLPMAEVVSFKREVYRSALHGLAPLLGHSPPETTLSLQPAT